MFLQIETDEGIVGWGEPVLEGHAEAAVGGSSAEDRLIGQDPLRINDLWQTVTAATSTAAAPS